MPLHILHPQSVMLPNTTVAFALLGSAAGTFAMLYPQDGIKAFGLKSDATVGDRALADAVIQLYGIRNLSTGVTNLAIWYMGRNTTGAASRAWRQALGLMFIMNVGVPLVDGMVAQRQGKSNPWLHWIFVPITLAIGSALLATKQTLV